VFFMCKIKNTEEITTAIEKKTIPKVRILLRIYICLP